MGIAVGGGAARGFALVGVLDALRRAGMTADYVAGTSIGAAIGAAYTLGYTAEEMTAVLQRLGGTVGRRLAFPAAVLSSAKLRAGVRAELGERLIEELPIPFAATATDVVSGEQVTFVEGPLWQAVMASMAVPGTFPPQLIGGRLLVDGGVVDQVPTRAAGALGADFVIAVRLPDVVRPMTSPTERWSFLQVLHRCLAIMKSKVATESAGSATIVIEPDVPAPLGIGHFAEGHLLVEAGEAAGRAALPRIASVLPWVGRGDGSQL